MVAVGEVGGNSMLTANGQASHRSQGDSKRRRPIDRSDVQMFRCSRIGDTGKEEALVEGSALAHDPITARSACLRCLACSATSNSRPSRFVSDFGCILYLDTLLYRRLSISIISVLSRNTTFNRNWTALRPRNTSTACRAASPTRSAPLSQSKALLAAPALDLVHLHARQFFAFR